MAYDKFFNVRLKDQYRSIYEVNMKGEMMKYEGFPKPLAYAYETVGLLCIMYILHHKIHDRQTYRI